MAGTILTLCTMVHHGSLLASAMRKAKMGTHKGTVKEIMYGAHCDVLVEDPEADLTPESLVTTLQAATGAHKPNG